MIDVEADANTIRFYCLLLNQLFEMEQKLEQVPDSQPLRRHVQRMRDLFAEHNMAYDSPLGEPFRDTRTDVEAHIAGEGHDDLRIVEVIKPVIRIKAQGNSRIVQKGVVIVESRPETSNG